jgi:hypothetical protein
MAVPGILVKNHGPFSCRRQGTVLRLLEREEGDKGRFSVSFNKAGSRRTVLLSLRLLDGKEDKWET